jgi:hypothetical protein
MQAPRSGCIERSERISMPKPCWRWSPSFCARMACLLGSPLIMIPARSSAKVGRDFPSALVRFLWCLGVEPSAHPAASSRSQCLCNGVIAKDKFCLSRSVRLNRSQEKRFEHPVEQDHRSSQEQTHTTALPILEHSAPLSSLLPWVEAASIRRISRCLPANCLVLLQATDGREAMRTAIYVRVSTVRASAEPDHRTTTGAATDALPGPLLGLAGRADLSR